MISDYFFEDLKSRRLLKMFDCIRDGRRKIERKKMRTWWSLTRQREFFKDLK